MPIIIIDRRRLNVVKRPHHNTKGLRQVKRGKTRKQVAAIARRLGIPLKERTK